MSIDTTIGPEEYLFRGLNDYWIKNDGSISTGAFSDNHGVSVDRSGGRDEVECISSLDRFSGVCSIRNSDVNACGAVSVYSPSKANPYHSEIHKSDTEIPLTKHQMKELAQSFKIVFRKEN